MSKLSSLYTLIRHTAMHKSVIRRSIMVMCFVVPGHILNLALSVSATHILDDVQFGIFYTAISIINMLFTPAAILMLLQTREMAQEIGDNKESAAIDIFQRYFKTTVVFGGALSLIGLIALSFLGFLIQVDSFFMILLIVLSAYLAYPAETIRSAFQGLQRFFLMGAVGLLWMFLRFVFGLGGIMIFDTPSAGVMGFVLATLVLCAVFYPHLTRKHSKTLSQTPFMPFNLKNIWPFVTGLGLFSGFMYADILLGYLFLDNADLGVYSASAILPKAVILVCLPVAQVLFPVLIKQRLQQDKYSDTINLVKGAAMTIGISFAAIIFIYLAKPYVCGTGYGIKSCAPDLLMPLIISAMPICLLRLLVMYQLSHFQDYAPISLLIPIGGYGAYLSQMPVSDMGLLEFAQTFHAFTWATLGFYVLQVMVTYLVIKPRQVSQPS